MRKKIWGMVEKVSNLKEPRMGVGSRLTREEGTCTPWLCCVCF